MTNSDENFSIKTIERTFKSMVLEVIKQVEDTSTVISNPKVSVINKINGRDDYIDNLKCSIEDKCFNYKLNIAPEKTLLNYLRTVNIIATNLEHISDYSENIVSQRQFITDEDVIKHYDFKKFFTETLSGLNSTIKAVNNRDLNLALKICKSEFQLDNLFHKNLMKITDDLGTGCNTKALVTLLFIFSYLERMGDSLLNIGEAIIFYVLGEKLKIHNFEALEGSMVSFNGDEKMKDLNLKTIWDTRSGCRTTKVNKHSNQDKGAIFKEGKIKKIEKELENIRHWEKLKPGLAPNVINYQKGSVNGAMLVEYLNGYTFQQILLGHDYTFLKDALSEIQNTLLEIWDKTKEETELKSCFVEQFRSRFADTIRAHPVYDTQEKIIGKIKVGSFDSLIGKVGDIENELTAPFSVYTHGDFNIDNILYDNANKKLYFLDLYRSARQDYLQDVSVFLVSNFRQPVFIPKVRKKINYVISDFFEFSKRFANKNGDKTFEARIAIGLARSLMTSTRFEFDEQFSSEMQCRSVYLLEKLISHNGRPWEEFSIPIDVILY